MIQLQAGYVFDCVKEELAKHHGKETIENMLKHLSFFYVDIDTTIKEIDNSGFEQILFVAHNLISRGLPTRPSYWVENTILETNDWTEKDFSALETGTIKRNLVVDKNEISSLFRAFHIIDPSLTQDNILKKKIDSWEDADNSFEEDFLYHQVPTYLPAYWMQLFESRRKLDNLLCFSTKTEDEVDKYMNGSIQLFNEQAIDFSIEYPYPVNDSRGIIVEIDTPLHKQPDQLNADNNRDTATEIAKFGRAIRIKTSEWNSIEEKIRRIEFAARSNYLKTIEQNYLHPLYLSAEGLSAMEIALMPFAIARIQKTLIHLLLNGKLDLNAKEWNIAVLERDVPCAKVAVNDFKQLMQHLLVLQDSKDMEIPQINLVIESNKRFINSSFYSGSKIDRYKTYDLFLDISILQRIGLSTIDDTINATTKVLSRSSYSQNAPRCFYTSSPVRYKPLGYKNQSNDSFEEDKSQTGILEIFLRDIFRKTVFKAGQIDIINRAIQGDSVIGLLPTNAGKSLTYQLTALLQPGMVLVINPTESLMKDQYEDLLSNGIDSAIYISSSLRKKERKKALEITKKAQTIFVLIDPEKLRDSIFRKELLETSNLNHNYFSYCAINEAHCISEWGHDFRTSYLDIGKNARKYCQTRDTKNIPFIALTATASYNVLFDIQQELDIKEDKAIIRSSNFVRPEIQFKVIEVTADLDINAGLNQNNKDVLEDAKRQELVNILHNISPDYENTDENNDTDARQQAGANTGLIFYPYRNGNFSTSENVSYLKAQFPNLKISTLLGNDKTDAKNQSLFNDNQLEWLGTTHSPGIGINKSDIRNIIHFNYPNSIESYYQETGRAGRDGKPATAILLFNRQNFNIRKQVNTFENEEILIKTNLNKKVSIDKDILHHQHKCHFKGIQKEKQFITELISEIKFPSRKVTNYIEERVHDEFSIEISLLVTNNDDREILYIQPDLGSIYLDMENLPFHFVKTPLAVKIADFVKQIILLEKPDDVTPFEWLGQCVHRNFSAPGIENLLNNNETPNSLEIQVPFTNNKIEEITNYLNENKLAFTERMVFEAQEYCIDENEFIQALEQKYNSTNNQLVSVPENLRMFLRKLFTEIRNEQDTLTAIYRLSIIGVIDDYIVDYNSKTITALLSRKQQGYYTGQLKKFLLRYNSPETTEEMIRRLPAYKEETEMQQCISSLINFIYEEIAQQRETAIDTMEEVCITGIQENGNQKIKEFIQLYMDSKYANPSYLPSDTNNGLIADFTIIEKYTELVRTEQSEINNLKHLKNAAIRLMTQYPDNFVFILLKAFALFSTEENDHDLISEAQADFIKGFFKAYKTSGEDVINLKREMSIFKEKLEKLNTTNLPEVEEAENIVLLTIHTNWLKEFNDNFIAYE